MDKRELDVVTQTTVTLPFLDDEVPALYLADGRPYIPVFAVCHALGIPPASLIRCWRNLALWVTARKLPFKTKKQGKRLGWCLLISHVPFLYGLFDWKLVSPERKSQLREATEAQIRLANRAYQAMQRSMETASTRLDGQASLTFEALIERRRGLYRDATAHVRKMLQDQETLPILDAVRVDANHTVVETFSMPLLPIVPEEDSTRFVEFTYQLAAWHVELAAFWRHEQERTGHESQG